MNQSSTFSIRFFLVKLLLVFIIIIAYPLKATCTELAPEWIELRNYDGMQVAIDAITLTAIDENTLEGMQRTNLTDPKSDIKHLVNFVLVKRNPNQMKTIYTLSFDGNWNKIGALASTKDWHQYSPDQNGWDTVNKIFSIYEMRKNHESMPIITQKKWPKSAKNTPKTVTTQKPFPIVR